MLGQKPLERYRVPARDAPHVLGDLRRISGNGGQKIFVFPSADLVVVFTGSSYNVARLSHRQPVTILNQYILPALTP